MNQYNKIAKDYIKTEKSIIKRYVENEFFNSLIGNLRNKKVIDLACGSGRYTRIIKKKGAKKVFGMDSSRKEIELARKIEKIENLGITYSVKNILKISFENEGYYDIATAVFLLHYAKSKNELNKMCEKIYKTLKSKGKFILINSHPDNPSQLDNKYGITAQLISSAKEGTKRMVTYYLNNKKICSFTNYYWKKKTYENALKKAGFIDIKWHEPKISDEGIKRYGEKFWEDFLKKPLLVGLTCTKQ